jgi:hypothetical protein
VVVVAGGVALAVGVVVPGVVRHQIGEDLVLDPVRTAHSSMVRRRHACPPSPSRARATANNRAGTATAHRSRITAGTTPVAAPPTKSWIAQASVPIDPRETATPPATQSISPNGISTSPISTRITIKAEELVVEESRARVYQSQAATPSAPAV